MPDTHYQYPLRRHCAYLSAFFMDFTFSSGSVAAVYLAKEQFAATPAQLGLFALLSAGIYVISTFAFGALSDRWGRRPNIMLACVLNVAAYLAAPWAGTLWQLYALMMVCSCGQGAFWPAIEADISDHSTPDELTRRLGRFNLAWGLGFISGSLGGGLLGQHVSQPAVFRMAAGLAAVAMLLHAVRRFAPEKTRARADQEIPVEQPAARGALLWKMALLVNFAATGLAATVRVHMPTVTGPGRSGLGGLFVGLFFVAQFVSFLVLAHWHGWRFRVWPLTVGSLLAAGGAAACGLFAGSYAFAAGCLLAGLGCGVTYNLSLYYSVAVSTGRGHRGGIHEAVLASGAAVVPYLGGLLATMPLVAGLAIAKGVPHLAAGVVLLAALLAAKARARAASGSSRLEKA